MAQSFGDGFGGTADFGMGSPLARDGKAFSDLKPGGKSKIGGKSVKHIPKPILPKDNFMKKYDLYADLKELDVCCTIDEYVREEQDRKTSAMLRMKNEAD